MTWTGPHPRWFDRRYWAAIAAELRRRDAAEDQRAAKKRAVRG